MSGVAMAGGVHTIACIPSTWRTMQIILVKVTFVLFAFIFGNRRKNNSQQDDQAAASIQTDFENIKDSAKPPLEDGDHAPAEVLAAVLEGDEEPGADVTEDGDDEEAQSEEGDEDAEDADDLEALLEGDLDEDADEDDDDAEDLYEDEEDNDEDEDAEEDDLDEQEEFPFARKRKAPASSSKPSTPKPRYILGLVRYV